MVSKFCAKLFRPQQREKRFPAISHCVFLKSNIIFVTGEMIISNVGNWNSRKKDLTFYFSQMTNCISMLRLVFSRVTSKKGIMLRQPSQLQWEIICYPASGNLWNAQVLVDAHSIIVPVLFSPDLRACNVWSAGKQLPRRDYRTRCLAQIFLTTIRDTDTSCNFCLSVANT